MSYFKERYAYVLEHMWFSRTTEVIVEYVFYGVLSEWTKLFRRQGTKGSV